MIVNAAGFDRVEPFMNNDDLSTSLVAVNYLGPVRLSHAFLTPIVAAERTAKIVNIASDTGRVGSTDETVYSGTKGGLIAFTKSLAREMARHRINVGPKDWDRAARFIQVVTGRPVSTIARLNLAGSSANGSCAGFLEANEFLRRRSQCVEIGHARFGRDPVITAPEKEEDGHLQRGRDLHKDSASRPPPTSRPEKTGSRAMAGCVVAWIMQ